MSYAFRRSRKRPPRAGTTGGDGSVVEKLPAYVRRVDVRLPRSGLSWSFSQAPGTLLRFVSPWGRRQLLIRQQDAISV
jgi:hypothetical protein